MTGVEVGPVLHRSGSGPSVLLLHPLGVDHTVWEPVARGLDGFTVLSCDLPGHGATPVLDTSHAAAGPAGIADLLATRLRDLEVAPTHVVGVSLGGLVALALAALHPGLVARLVVVDSVAVYPPAMRSMWLDRARQVRSTGTAPVVDQTLELWFTAAALAADGEEVRGVRRLLLDADPEGYAAACELLAASDVRALLPQVAAPTLVVCGEDDAPAFTGAAPGLASSVRNGTLSWLPGARHAGAVERPEELTRLVRSFLVEEPHQA